LVSSGLVASSLHLSKIEEPAAFTKYSQKTINLILNAIHSLKTSCILCAMIGNTLPKDGVDEDPRNAPTSSPNLKTFFLVFASVVQVVSKLF
jgi:hypothetical protein